MWSIMTCLFCRDLSPWWHVAHIFIQISSIRISPRRHVVRFPYPDSLRESTWHSHPNDRHITSGRPTYPIRIYLSGSLTKVSKSYYVISTACHSPRSATYRAKGQEWWQVTSHDLWQSRWLPRSLTAAYRVMMTLSPPRGIMTSQKVSLPLKRETEFLILYIWTFTQGER